MTIDDLINELEQARDTLGGDAEVRVAYQRNYPLRGTVDAVTYADTDDPYAEGQRAAGQDKDASRVWIAVGSAPYDENPYGPAWAWTGEFPEDEDCCPACGAAPGESHGCTLAERSTAS